ncbi:keratin, type II cytoskeletal 8-like [Mastacembelus armatus]|uniref:Keratin, type II cytoskeletal 8-like n=1 Tax=Mastacembelus armatus TaxID=205130 RepID=A0A3Q3M3Y2_9TELE|nr:keratin, type II cytoskeletal 8-like [Mastacembelus armatus]
MSQRRNSNSYKGLHMSSVGFNSKSTSSYSIPKISSRTNHGPPIKTVSINKDLLTPLNTGIDPSFQAVRFQEKEEIKNLNNRFVSFINKVRFLEQENKMLETKLKLLQKQTTDSSNIESMMKSYIANLQRQLELLSNGKDRLDMEKKAMHKNAEEYKTKYEEEIVKRNDAENVFVVLKKDVDAGYLSKVNLDKMLSHMHEEFNFYKAAFKEELLELQDSLKETSVMVQIDNSRDLNMDCIVAEVKAHYEDIATHSRKEAENWYKNKFDQMTAKADQYGNELRSAKGEIAELNRLISRLQNEIQTVRSQCTSLEDKIAEVQHHEEGDVQNAKAHIRDLELALQTAKQNMAHQIREYQDLMNVKMALDMEISTYRKLLEGEEERVGQEPIVNIQRVPTKTVRQQQRSGPVLIKTVETQDIIYS